ncbi:MAG: hypothetical protein COA83_09665 [Methylophaga sp.]|nr:MAG: hypothetical protein COA83_09665 [Methylophaga sp.]
MALPTGSAIIVFDTPVTALTTAVSIVSAGFSSTTITSVTSTAPLADAVLDVTMAVAPVAGDAFHLYRRDLNISGANDAMAPDANFKNTYVGSFPLDLVSTQQFISLTDIPLTVDQEFYIENDTLQATSGTTVLTITPKSYNTQA